MSFKDHFSTQAAGYAEFRPRYPRELFGCITSLAPAKNLAWDCATGSGQAAVGVAEFFEKVIATDASARQIEQAEKHARVTYQVATAEDSGLRSGSVAMITVAQALHWFEHAKFFAEAKRVMQPGGIIAVWGYNLLRIAPAIDALVDRFYYETVGPYWPPERALLEAEYRTIEFPFEEIATPQFAMEAEWSCGQLLGYLRTWSATQKFIEVHNNDPVVPLAASLEEAWGKNGARLVTWPLSLRVGRKLRLGAGV